MVTTYTHDAWNRLVSVAVGPDVRSEHEYNGLNWRVVSRADADGYYDGVLDRERVMIYDLSWRLIEERIDDDLDAEPGDGFDRVCQQVWGARHIDDAVLRRENRDFTNDAAGAVYESTWYYITDALFGVVAVIDGATGMTVERVRYLPYGGARHSRFADIDGDGATTGADQLLLLAASGAGVGEPGYLCEADGSCRVSRIWQ